MNWFQKQDLPSLPIRSAFHFGGQVNLPKLLRLISLIGYENVFVPPGPICLAQVPSDPSTSPPLVFRDDRRECPRPPQKKEPPSFRRWT